MNNRGLLLVLGLGLFSIDSLPAKGADDKKPPLPSGPLVHGLSDFGALQVTYAYPQDAAAQAQSAGNKPAPISNQSEEDKALEKPKSITLIRTKPLWHATVLGENGRTKMDHWSDGNLVFIEGKKPDEPLLKNLDTIVDASAVTIMLSALSQGHYPDVNWVSPETYVGVQPIKSRPCFVFRKDDRTAWVDCETQQLAVWQNNKEMRVFTALTPPNQLISLPAGMQKIADGLKVDRARLMRKPPRGG